MSESPIRAAVLTISDTRRPDNDTSGDTLVALLTAAGCEIAARSIVTDDVEQIKQALVLMTDREDVQLLLTTGGTGFAPRDHTPEATLAVIEREARGIAEAMRRETAVYHPMAMLSRAVCGIRAKTLIVNMPGSPKAVEQCFTVLQPVLRHAVKLISGDTAHD